MLLRRLALAGAASLALAAALAAPASALTFGPGSPFGRVPNLLNLGMTTATPAQTFATTTPADLAATAITFTPPRDPTQTEANGVAAPPEVLIVDWSADVSKATATTGACGIFVNGALVVNTKRFSSSASGQASIGGHAVIALTAAGSQVVKLQCVSGDTNVFTVNQAQMSALLGY